jgi:hypothetical protein
MATPPVTCDARFLLPAMHGSPHWEAPKAAILRLGTPNLAGREGAGETVSSFDQWLCIRRRLALPRAGCCPAPSPSSYDRPCGAAGMRNDDARAVLHPYPTGGARQDLGRHPIGGHGRLGARSYGRPHPHGDCGRRREAWPWRPVHGTAVGPGRAGGGWHGPRRVPRTGTAPFPAKRGGVGSGISSYPSAIILRLEWGSRMSELLLFAIALALCCRAARPERRALPSIADDSDSLRFTWHARHLTPFLAPSRTGASIDSAGPSTRRGGRH